MRVVLLTIVVLLAFATQGVRPQLADWQREQTLAAQAAVDAVLDELFEDTLQATYIQTLFDTAPYTIEVVNTTEEILDFAENIADFFNEQKTIVKILANGTSAIRKDMATRGIKVTDDYCPECPMYAPDDVLNLAPDTKYIASRQDFLSLNYSNVRFPNSVERTEQLAQLMGHWSMGLDDTFLDLHKEAAADGLQWMYYGDDETGGFRLYPANVQGRNFLGFYTDFEPRLRPWYTLAGAGVKDIVIVLDASGSMALNGRLEIAKAIATNIVTGLTQSDYVNIIVNPISLYSIANRDLQIKDRNATSLTCFNTLVPCTPAIQSYLLSQIGAVTASGVTVYDDALTAAYNMMRTSRNARLTTGCTSLIAFISDGIAIGGSVWHYLQEASTNELCVRSCPATPNPAAVIAFRKYPDLSDVKVFTLGAGEDSGTSSILRGMSCGSGGQFQPVKSTQNLYKQMSMFNEYLVMVPTEDVYQTAPYLDTAGAGILTTYTQSVYDDAQPDKPFLGVVAIDISLAVVENTLSNFGWHGGYVFQLNAVGEAVIHPKMKTSTQLVGSPEFYDILQLEGDSTEMRLVKKNMIDLKTGSLSTRASHVAPRGSYAEGFQTVVAETLYTYTSVDTTTSICLVLYDGSSLRIFNDTEDFTQLWYHRFDVYSIPASMIQTVNTIINKPILPKHAVFVPAPRCFCDPNAFLTSGINETTATAMNAYMNTTGDPLTCEEGGLVLTAPRQTMHVLSQVVPLWQLQDNSNILFRYVGLESGITVMYPGVTLKDSYDPTRSDWYGRSRAYRGNRVISSRYLGSAALRGADKRIVTLSQAIASLPYVPPANCTMPRDNGCLCNSSTECLSEWCRNGECIPTSIAGASAIDMKYESLDNLLSNATQGLCEQSCGVNCVHRCFLMDDRTILLWHPSFKTENTKTPSIKRVGDLEPAVAFEWYYAGYMNSSSYVNYAATCLINDNSVYVAATNSDRFDVTGTSSVSSRRLLEQQRQKEENSNIAHVVHENDKHDDRFDSAERRQSYNPKSLLRDYSHSANSNRQLLSGTFPSGMDGRSLTLNLTGGPIAKTSTKMDCVVESQQFTLSPMFLTNIERDGMINGTFVNLCAKGTYHIVKLPKSEMYLVIVYNYTQPTTAPTECDFMRSLSTPKDTLRSQVCASVITARANLNCNVRPNRQLTTCAGVRFTVGYMMSFVLVLLCVVLTFVM